MLSSGCKVLTKFSKLVTENLMFKSTLLSSGSKFQTFQNLFQYFSLVISFRWKKDLGSFKNVNVYQAWVNQNTWNSLIPGDLLYFTIGSGPLTSQGGGHAHSSYTGHNFPRTRHSKNSDATLLFCSLF